MLNYAEIQRCLFFFSSRRRHTRFDCDWSSDVCSSDLVTMPLTSPRVESEAQAITKRKRRLDSGMAVLKVDSWPPSANKVESTLLLLVQQRPISGSATPDSASTRGCTAILSSAA